MKIIIKLTKAVSGKSISIKVDEQRSANMVRNIQTDLPCGNYCLNQKETSSDLTSNDGFIELASVIKKHKRNTPKKKLTYKALNVELKTYKDRASRVKREDEEALRNVKVLQEFFNDEKLGWSEYFNIWRAFVSKHEIKFVELENDEKYCDEMYWGLAVKDKEYGTCFGGSSWGKDNNKGCDETLMRMYDVKDELESLCKVMTYASIRNRRKNNGVYKRDCDHKGALIDAYPAACVMDQVLEWSQKNFDVSPHYHQTSNQFIADAQDFYDLRRELPKLSDFDSFSKFLAMQHVDALGSIFTPVMVSGSGKTK